MLANGSIDSGRCISSCLFVFLQELLGLKFTEVKDADVWHEDVRMVSCLIFYLVDFLTVCSWSTSAYFYPSP